MNDEKFLVNDGNSVKEVPVESKEATLTSTPAETGKPSRERTALEEEVDAEIIAKDKAALEDFDETQAIVVPAKRKRGRPTKQVVREFNCATCRERISELNAMKIGAGDNRYAIFCPYCQKSMGFIDVAAEQKLDALHRHPNSK